MNHSSYHFIGIGGIGMSALARIAAQLGARVTGSDRASSALIETLKSEGIEIQIGHNASAIRGQSVVFTSALEESNPELVEAKRQGVTLLHRSDFLDRLMREKRPLLIAGTHGKTTTTALTACVLLQAGFDPSFVVGGIVRSLQTNAKAGSGEYFIAEADESDGSFLKTAAFGAIVTNRGNDHLDFWKSPSALEEAFRRFFAQVKNPRHLFWCFDDEGLKGLTPPGFSYGFSEGADLQISHYEEGKEGIVFDIAFQGRLYPKIALSLSGRHNALNASAVFGLALSLGVEPEAIRSAMSAFLGTKRRLEYKGEGGGIVLFDDYGHHPTEIRATLGALRGKMGRRRLVVLFQPHRYTRVRDLFDSFCDCLAGADLVVLTDIYSAGEAPIANVTTEALYNAMRQRLKERVCYMPRDRLVFDLPDQLHPLDVVLTLGAGDITHVADSLLARLQKRLE